MKAYDFVYGEFDIPDIIDPLVFAPEFQRLSNVRLLNTNSPTLSSLSEITRYSHTIGVLRLALLNSSIMMSSDEYIAFLAAVILHDVGTPAYAHLLEYQLNQRFGWNHESTAFAITNGTHHTDGVNTQLFQDLPADYESLCKKCGIDFGIVQSIIAKEHPSHRLLFGSLDLDNLDNVVRMAIAIGHPLDLRKVIKLAENIGFSNTGCTVLSRDLEDCVQYWASLRETVYRVLVFDSCTVSRQAVLSRCIRLALNSGELDQSDWIYNDSELIRVLEQTGPRMKSMIHRDFKSEPPALCLLCHIDRQVSEFLAKFTPESIVSHICLLYTSPSPRDRTRSRMPSSA